MKHILLTGGAGFIGSHLAESLLQSGDIRITCLDNFDVFYARQIKEHNLAAFRNHPQFEFIELSIQHHDALYERLQHHKFDAIVHLAAKAGVRPSIETVEAYYQTNVMGTLSLLELARKLGVKQFVFGSSSSVYGENPQVPWKEHDTDLQPISPYAASKISGEATGRIYAHLYGIRFLALRFFTVYGPRQRPDLAIHKFAQMILNGQSIPVFGDGSTSRDYTYVADIVRGIEAAINYEGAHFEAFNIGSGRTISLAKLIGSLEEALQIKAIIEHLPEQPGDVKQTFADISKAQKLLHYQPSLSFDEGIRRFVEWKLNSGLA
jgi:UDP-glucuronate 4-epimerase